MIEAGSTSAPAGPPTSLTCRMMAVALSIDVIDVLSDLFILRGVPGHIRSDNGPEFVATRLVPGLRLFDIKCAWFNEHEYWEFFPRTLFTRG
jgi:putative transposase